MMKALFWISLFLPLAVVAEDIDYFAPKHITTEPAAPAKTESGKGWGQGLLSQLGSLTTKSITPATPKSPSTLLSPAYLQQQLKAKDQEIMHVRQQIPQTMDGQKIQSLTGTLQRLEGERARILQELKPEPSVSSMAAPTPSVHKISLQEPSVLPVDISEEDALKVQVERLTKEEAALSNQIKSTTDTNILSTLSSQLERTQQNKSLAILSFRDVQRRNLETSTKGFGSTLLPPHGIDMDMTHPSLAPSFEQIAPPALHTPQPTGGWGGLVPNMKMTPTSPLAPPQAAPTALPRPQPTVGWSGLTPLTKMAPTAPLAPPQAAPKALTTPWPTGWGTLPSPDPKPATEPAVTPAGTPMTGEDWQQARNQSKAHFESKNKNTHTTYGASSKPLWTPAEPLTTPRKSVPPHAPIDHQHLVAKIRGERILSH